MDRRPARSRGPTALLAVFALVAAGCGDDEPDPVVDDTPTEDTADDSREDTADDSREDTADDSPTDEPGDDTAAEPEAGGHTHPTGADDVILEYDVSGGFTTARVAFGRPPRLVVSGDGRAFTVGPVVAVFPGPLLPNVQVRTISEDGIQQLLAAADEAGLLAGVDYEDPTDIADAPTTTLTINADGRTWVHSADALAVNGGPGPGAGESSPEREQLADFLATSVDLATVVDPAELGEEEAYAPEEYLVRAQPVDDLDARAVEGIEPRVLDWPAGATPLGEVGECAAIPADEAVSALFAKADELTFFEDGDVVHEVVPKPVYPGIACPE